MRYFFNKWAGFVKAAKNRHILLLLDFDGTLAPIVKMPAKAKLPPEIRRYLKDLSGRKRVTVGIVSGRGLGDVTRLVGISGIYYAGSHGLDINGPRGRFVHPLSRRYKPYLRQVVRRLRRNISGIKGAIIEDKRLAVSLHYRLVAAKDIARLRNAFRRTCAPYIKRGKIRTTAGKKILEVRPPVSWGKGEAVKKIEKMARKKNALKLFVGDDITDEDAFRALGKKDFAIRVFRKKSSKAGYFLKNPGEVGRLLMKIARIITLLFFIMSAPVFSPAQEAPAPPPPKVWSKVYNVKTKDGWDISINRYVVVKVDQQPKAAVILCHGFNINNKFWDLDDKCSLAKFLARAGYDVWAPSLRGSGLSSRPFLSRVRSLAKFELEEIPQMLITTPFDINKIGWTIDDHIRKDVPAIIGLVKEKSGFDKVYWIGHSMGGIVMYGYLETENQEDIAGFIPIGSMMVIEQPLTLHLQRIASQKPLLTASLIVNTTVASQFRNFTLGAVKNPIEELLFNEKNMDKDILFRFFRTCIDDTSAGVVTQFSDSIRKGEIVSSDGRYSYTDNMGRVEVPILITAGGADGFVKETAMRECLERVSSRDKDILIFSKANGYSADYGHCDLILGKNSRAEVYPKLLEWLDLKTAPKRFWPFQQ